MCQGEDVEGLERVTGSDWCGSRKEGAKGQCSSEHTPEVGEEDVSWPRAAPPLPSAVEMETTIQSPG